MRSKKGISHSLFRNLSRWNALWKGKQDLTREKYQAGNEIFKVAQGVTRSELRKVRAIVSLIGEENLPSLPRSEYQCLKGLHVYTARNGDNELSLSIWNEPKENQSSRCLFADRIGLPAFNAALEYWRPRYYPGSNLRDVNL